MNQKKRLDRNFLIIAAYFTLIVVWFYHIQSEFIYNGGFLSPVYRSISHSGDWHLFRNVGSLFTTSSFLVFFVTYRFFIIVPILTGVSSYWYYGTHESMVGFSVVTSGLMGAVLVIYIVNAIILLRKERIKQGVTTKIHLGSRMVNVSDRASRLLFGYHTIIFLYASNLRLTDFVMHIGLLDNRYDSIPQIILHGADHVRHSMVIEAHLFGFMAGVLATIFVITWTMVFHRMKYEERIAKMFER